MKLEFATAYGHRFTTTNKALQLQCVTDVTGGNANASRGAYGDCMVGSWCLIAPPAAPTVDTAGNVTSACEVAGVQVGDQIIALGQRDVRWSKFGQDAKPGEVALFNAWGARLFLGQNAIAINARGAFISFDYANKKVGIAGYSATPGGGAPYFTMDTLSAGMVSATGGASVNVKDDQATLSGASISLNGGTVVIGTGATDFVALASLIMAELNVIKFYLNTHYHNVPALGASSTPFIVLVGPAPAAYNPGPVASTRAKCA